MSEEGSMTVIKFLRDLRRKWKTINFPIAYGAKGGKFVDLLWVVPSPSGRWETVYCVSETGFKAHRLPAGTAAGHREVQI